MEMSYMVRHRLRVPLLELREKLDEIRIFVSRKVMMAGINYLHWGNRRMS